MPLDQDEPRQCTSSMGIPGEGGGGGYCHIWAL